MEAMRITDDYDRRAYANIRRTIERHPSWFGQARDRLGERASAAAGRVTGRIPARAGDAVELVVGKTLAGIRFLTIDPAFRSVKVRRVLDSYVSAGAHVDDLADITHLPLRIIDAVVPSLGWRYAAVAAVEGASAGAAITGAELLATAETVATAGVAAAPGVGTVAAAMAFDAASVLAASARVVAHTGAYYGYDTRLPEEQLFALSIINWSSAGTGGAKHLAFTQLSQITQQLVRGATWAQLSEHALVGVIEKVFVRLGFRLTKEKLGQAIPVLGIAIGAGLNAQILSSIASDASTAYRMRHLVEQYDLAAETMPTSTATSSSDHVIDVDPIDIIGMLGEAADEN